MKNLIIVIFVALAGYFILQNFSKDTKIDPIYSEPYIAVYGRDRCGWTHKYLNDLREKGLEPIYEIVDDKETADVLHSRMQEAGLDTRRYDLPVIDVNGQMFIRPELDIVMAAYETED